MADALERITNLVALLLESRGPMTLERIAFELSGFYEGSEVAVRGAFERDKALLRDLGVPIESEVLSGADAGRTGYRIDRRRYELADLHLTDDERHALQTAVAAARLDQGAFGLLKLGAAAEGSTDVVANVPDLPALPSLREAVASRSAATFSYHGRSRTLHPYVLLLRDGFWYVIGFDPAAGETRTYRVDRIEVVKDDRQVDRAHQGQDGGGLLRRLGAEVLLVDDAVVVDDALEAVRPVALDPVHHVAAVARARVSSEDVARYDHITTVAFMGNGSSIFDC